MQEKFNNNEINNEPEEKVEFTSFSEVDENNNFNEAYGYFRESSMAEMFEQYEAEENIQKKTR